MEKAPKFHFQFLGTGTSAGIPFLHCSCKNCVAIAKDKSKHKMRMSAIIYLEDGHNILIDCGTDIRRELLCAKVDHIDAIIMTHAHADHLHGLHDLRRFSIAQKEEIPLYCDKDVCRNLNLKYYNDVTDESAYDNMHSSSDNTLNNEQSSNVQQSEKIKKYFDVHELDATKSQEFVLFGLKFTTIPIMHGKLPIIGYKFDNFVYITDAKTISNESYQIIKSTKVTVYIINTLNEDEHPTHFTFEQTLQSISIVQPEIAYLIHPSHKSTHEEIGEWFKVHQQQYDAIKNIPIIVTKDYMQVNYKEEIESRKHPN